MVKRMDNEGEDERKSHMSGREIVRGEPNVFILLEKRKRKEQVPSERAASTSGWGPTFTNTGEPSRTSLLMSVLHGQQSSRFSFQSGGRVLPPGLASWWERI